MRPVKVFILNQVSSHGQLLCSVNNQGFPTIGKE